MINALALLDSNIAGTPSLTLITTSNTTVSKDILDYASENNVMLYQAIAAIDDETGEFIISDRKWINRDNRVWGYGGAYDRIKNLCDWDNYDSYGGIDPSSYVNKKSTQSQDPDPCSTNDY